MTLQKLLEEGREQLKKAEVPDWSLDARYLLLAAFDLSLASFLAVSGRELPEDTDTQEKILHFLEELWNSNQVTISTLEQFRRELMQMIYRYLNKQDVLITRIFDGREFDEHYESAVATLPDMEIFPVKKRR